MSLPAVTIIYLFIYLFIHRPRLLPMREGEINLGTKRSDPSHVGKLGRNC